MIEIILILIAVLSYREIGILCQRRSYDFKAFKYIYWQTSQDNFWTKNFDWFHISNGLIVWLIVLLAMNDLPKLIWYWLDSVIYWYAFFYIRNIWMHVILPRWDSKSPQLRLWYLVPLAGGFLDNKFRDR